MEKISSFSTNANLSFLQERFNRDHGPPIERESLRSYGSVPVHSAILKIGNIANDLAGKPCQAWPLICIGTR
jgi:hypothetical protein